MKNSPQSGSSPSQERLFAVVPAAGLSRRMGRPKLLLPIGSETVIERLLRVLDHPSIEQTVVVLRQSDEALRQHVLKGRGLPVQPDIDPPDMRTSITHALETIKQVHAPHHREGWLLIPADHPLLNADVLATLLQRWQTGKDEILIPVYQGKRGHPAFFRWSLTHRLNEIPPDQGLNWLVRQPDVRVTEFPVESPTVLTDLDTPEDYALLLQTEHEKPSERTSAEKNGIDTD